MLEGPSQQAGPVQVGKPINLVPVGLKEAALDSPTFRSGFTHFSEQLELVERWLDNYVRSISKLVNEVGTLEALVNVFFTQSALPLNASEAVIDHDYTLLAMKRYGEAAREYWTSTIASLKRMEANMVEPIRSFLQNDLRSFKDARRQFEQTQKQLDNLQARYSGQTRAKEASSLREDAFQLHEARKSYLKASMDFSVLAPQLRMALDKILVKVFSDQWREMRSRDNIVGSHAKWANDIERVRGWSREMEAGEKGFKRELLNARKQIEDKAEIAMRPSRELEDYSAAANSVFPSVNNLQAPGAGTSKAERQGWLNHRTVTGKPSRTVWVRRWFFVKNGIFGWLVQGSRSGGVEESERIGVLLCSVRPAISEERRFCFEVKTKDRTLTMQAETQPELSEWVRSFEVAKQKALEDPASTDSPGLDGPRGQDAAFAITPPSAPELAASGADSAIPQMSDDGLVVCLDRNSSLPIPGGESGLNLASRSSSDVNASSKRLAADGESGRDHAARIIQKLDLHRKSTGGAQMTGAPATPTSSTAGGIASLISASHNIMPIGPGISAPAPDTPTVRVTSGSNFRELPTSTLAPSTLANPPAPTNLSTTAIILTGERGIGMGRIDSTGGMPSGIMANIWGSSNWGYLNRLERGELRSPAEARLRVSNPPSPQSRPAGSPPKKLFNGNNETSNSLASEASVTPGTSPSHRKTISLGSETQKAVIATQEFPKYYPLQLKTQDAQFRLLFPNVRREEKVVLVFRATWNLNDQQEFPGRVYVTAREVYFYSHYLGLVLTSGIGLSSIAEITAAPGRDCDFLFLHLKDNSTQTGFTRITIKTFLEPLRLLHKRLDFLVRNCNSDEPLDLESIMRTLIRMDQDEPNSSTGTHSWEDISRDAPYDESDGLRRNTSQRNQGDLRAAVLVGSGSHMEDGRDVTKFKLPKQPVVFAPAGMDQAAVVRDFDISPKALFHILFGDKSAVWQLLYHERQAKRIKQTAWIQPAEGHLRREFEYQIDDSDMFGRSRQATVVDYQMIDVSNDHLCYVVTDRKTAWYLPSNQNFLLLSKIVITYIAKSKCKLAIYTKVDWIKRPGISQSLITKRALRDLELDALDLADVVAEQVRKLGAHSRTKRAIQIFGAIGQQTEASEYAGSDATSNIRTRRSVKRRTMTDLLLESTGLLVEGIVTSLKAWILAVLIWLWKTFDANIILLGILALSICTNLLFSSMTTSQWWRERNAGKYMARLGVGPDPVMSRALYIQDLDVAANHFEEPFDAIGSKCRQTFESLTSLSSDSISSRKPKSSDTRTSRRLQRTRQTLGTYRHDLLVAMRVVNSIEREVVQAEYEDWLMGENRRCSQLQDAIAENRTEQFNNRLNEIKGWQGEYCESCVFEQERVFGSPATV